VREPLRKKFGRRVAAVRKAAGYSQEGFADECGFARSFMSRIERGVGNPTLRTVETICTALRVPAVKLFEDA
jgi:transcriptional regulator with XRE-family HTH domain